MIENIKERYHELQSRNGKSVLTPLEQNAFDAFTKMGIPTVRHEEWKYTRISGLFNHEYELAGAAGISENEWMGIRLPGHEEANVLVFLNGSFAKDRSEIRSSALQVQSLEEAAENEHAEVVANNLGHSSQYIKDGINALNTAFAQEGIFISVGRGQVVEHPVYIYHLSDARSSNIFSQPRVLVHVGESAQVQLVEHYATLGKNESFTSQVMEVVVEKEAVVEYYKIQNDALHSNQVNTTHFRQRGKSLIHAVTISLSGSIVRNNLNMVMEADHSEAHLYGLYFLKGGSHVDNHTVVDNVKPNCFSNELYKGIVADNATAVFNGKIFVQPQAQKTNAFQSNKNILLSDNASVNTKPQLEIFADDVKCSHGCTVGQLDEEGLFYLRSRGIPENMARALLVRAYALDILEQVKLTRIREYIDQLISQQLDTEA